MGSQPWTIWTSDIYMARESNQNSDKHTYDRRNETEIGQNKQKESETKRNLNETNIE